MSCLSDLSIMGRCEKELLVVPYDGRHVQPASYELTFDGSYVLGAHDIGLAFFYSVRDREFQRFARCVNNPEGIKEKAWVQIEPDRLGNIYLNPGEFYIASTREKLNIPNDLMARVEGKSSLGRCGLMVHVTAGYIDPGFSGTITLEMMNLSPWPVAVRDGDPIAQISFHTMDQPVYRPYGTKSNHNHYQGQSGPTLAR